MCISLFKGGAVFKIKPNPRGVVARSKPAAAADASPKYWYSVTRMYGYEGFLKRGYPNAG